MPPDLKFKNKICGVTVTFRLVFRGVQTIKAVCKQKEIVSFEKGKIRQPYNAALIQLPCAKCCGVSTAEAELECTCAVIAGVPTSLRVTNSRLL